MRIFREELAVEDDGSQSVAEDILEPATPRSRRGRSRSKRSRSRSRSIGRRGKSRSMSHPRASSGSRAADPRRASPAIDVDVFQGETQPDADLALQLSTAAIANQRFGPLGGKAVVDLSNIKQSKLNFAPAGGTSGFGESSRGSSFGTESVEGKKKRGRAKPVAEPTVYQNFKTSKQKLQTRVEKMSMLFSTRNLFLPGTFCFRAGGGRGGESATRGQHV